jgi:Dolichyl-phosphate-mannose-protein mannosyltransferase
MNSPKPGKNRRYEKALVVLFLLTLPLINPWVRGDGVGYYAYIRSMLIEGHLNFERDWLAANTSFRLGRTDDAGHLKPQEYTSTHHLDNHFSVGPAILWSPFLVTAHLGVLAANQLGAHIPADGFSRPYVIAMAFATALYGFLGLYLSFRLSREYFEESWAFLATIGIWLATSLPVYMYFNPSWSHAHSAFATALFLWYWHRTRQAYTQKARTWKQWVILGLLAGLMLDVYYPNFVFLLLPLLEALRAYTSGLRGPREARTKLVSLFAAHVLFVLATLVAFSPTLVTRKIIYGSPWSSGYESLGSWNWTSPVLGKVLFSSDHGLLVWTPILLPAVLGLVLLRRRDGELGDGLIATFLAFYYLIASYASWDGLSSFGNRFFVSLTPLFVIGLAAVMDALAAKLPRRRAAPVLAGATAALILWNLGFIFQWGTHLVPARGPISWREMASNQFTVVPVRITRSVVNYLTARREMMGHIEEEDVQQQLEKRKAEGE